MKTRLLACLGTLLFTTIGHTASAESLPSSASINFSGSIFNGSCNMDVKLNPVAFICSDPQSGKTVAQYVDVRKAQTLAKLPVSVNTAWLDAGKRKGIVSVTYL
ncbi:type 1 fimbrial protein [Pantoea sp.]|uniref:type 1 fimbrial protein n=1 Tax=Pantoea sp. TaxID=69393 RepID=UPI0029084F0D|nr:type 1 fimbrial protein [Pantoea sp.]MDU4128401.1 type 1 fimbrial protein [Pantoea sp.]